VSRLVVCGCDVLVRPGDLRPDHDLVIAGGLVESIVPTGTAWTDAETLEGAGLLAIPGLINAHTHSPESCLRGIGEGLPLEPWLLLMFGGAGFYDADDHYVCALAGAVEMLKAGTTACIDHLWMTPPALEAAEAALRAYRDAGIRGAVAPLMADLDCTPDVGAAYGLDVEEASFARRLRLLPAAELVAQLEELLSRWHGAEDARLRVLAGPAGVQWSSDELLTGLADSARRHGTGIHLHLLETQTQDAACRLRFGTSAVAALERLGVLGADCSLAHCVGIDDDDVELIATEGAVVVHNPAANLRLGSGRAPVPELLAAGAVVAIGTDGAASSDNQVLWDSLKLACLVHNESEPGRVLAREALAMATDGGGRAFGDQRLGSLEPGSAADVALLERASVGLAGAVELEASLVLSDGGRSVRHVFVGGELVVREGRCTRVDEDGVLEGLKEQVAKRRPGFLAPSKATELAMSKVSQLRRAIVSAGGRSVGHQEEVR
jgi:5-methylthioadenosine/S-adenosylhomocysteine deaminase